MGDCNCVDEENDGVTEKKGSLHGEDSLVVVSQREVGVGAKSLGEGKREQSLKDGRQGVKKRHH